MDDVYNLDRFVEAQNRHEAYLDALDEIRAGSKQRHWMWFVFPQIAGLGSTPTAAKFAIANLDEARAYLEHPVLGRRLTECARALTELTGKDAEAVFGPTDAMKLRSSMTLFSRAARNGQVFQDVLDQYFEGQPDARTISRL